MLAQNTPSPSIIVVLVQIVMPDGQKKAENEDIHTHRHIKWGLRWKSHSRVQGLACGGEVFRSLTETGERTVLVLD